MTRRLSTSIRIIQYLQEKNKANPYEVWKEISKYKKVSYQVICRYFYLLERCGIIRLSEVKKEKTKFPLHYYELVSIDEYVIPEDIRRDAFFRNKSKEEIYYMLMTNPQMIFESYRRRNEYPSAKEAVKKYWERRMQSVFD